jgi:sulfite oxidase
VRRQSARRLDRKWLERIELRSAPSEGYFQHVVYRLLPQDGTPGPGAGTPLGLVALNADVLSPADGKTLAGATAPWRSCARRGGRTEAGALAYPMS